MVTIKPKANSYLDKWWFLTLYLLMLFPILPKGIESISMILFAFLTLLKAFNERDRNCIKTNRKQILMVLLLSVIFLFSAISLVYSENLEQGLDQTIRVLPVIMFPVVFGFLTPNTLNPKDLDKIKYLYIFAVLICAGYLNIRLFDTLYVLDKTHWQIRQSIEGVIDVHGTYLSIWMGFGILILFSKVLKKTKNTKTTLLHLLAISFLLYWQITIGSRMPIIMTLGLLILQLIIRFHSKKMTLVFISILSVFVLIIISSRSQIIERVGDALTFEHTLPKGDYSLEHRNISSEDIRKGIFYCTWILVKEAPFFGYGIGDVQDNLNLCYKEQIDSNVYQRFVFNTHNQYFNIWLSAGLFALLLFLTSLLVPIYISIKRKDYLLFSFTILVMFCSLTENILSRHDGVLFYGLFNSILFFNCLNKNQEESS